LPHSEPHIGRGSEENSCNQIRHRPVRDRIGFVLHPCSTRLGIGSDLLGRSHWGDSPEGRELKHEPKKDYFSQLVTKSNSQIVASKQEAEPKRPC